MAVLTDLTLAELRFAREGDVERQHLARIALAQHAGEVAQRFREVAARLLLDLDDDDEEEGPGPGPGGRSSP